MTAQAPPTAAAFRRLRGSKEPTVLIVDEYDGIARLEAVIARACGCTPQTVTSGAAALELLASANYDVILLGSPVHVDESTLMLERIMSDLPRLARRTVVVTTQPRGSRVLRLAAEAGVFAVVAKPFDINVLADVIWRCVRNRGRGGQPVWIGAEPPDAALDAATVTGETFAGESGGSELA